MICRQIKFILFLQVVVLCLGCQNTTLGIPLGSATNPSMPGCPTGPKTCIFLTWNASTTPNVGYHIWYGTSSGNYTVEGDAGTALSYQITGLSPGTYYIAATAYLLSGSSDSTYSNEASAAIPLTAAVKTAGYIKNNLHEEFVSPEISAVIPERQ